MKNKPNLPRCVWKSQLVDYFDCSYDYLWSNLITDELLHGWGVDLDRIKKLKKLGPDLTRRIYIHFGITDLDANLAEEVRREIEGMPCSLPGVKPLNGMK